MTTEQMEKEIKRVQIECFMSGFEYVGISGDGCGNMVGHSVRRLGEKNIFPVDIGQRVEFAYATEKAIDNMIESVMNPPVVSKGPSGIGGEYQIELFDHAIKDDGRHDSILRIIKNATIKLGAKLLVLIK